MEDKKKALFDALECAERNLNKAPSSSIKSDSVFDRNIRSKREVTEKYKHQKSIFKKPAIRRSFQTIKPAFELNPEKFTKYSLDDVNDISDNTNKRAAYKFLREMEDRKEKDTNNSEISEKGSEKIVFKRSAKLKPSESDRAKSGGDQKRFQGNKLIMKEYVVGEGKRKLKHKNKIETATNSQLKLSHLQDDDEGD